MDINPRPAALNLHPKASISSYLIPYRNPAPAEVQDSLTAAGTAPLAAIPRLVLVPLEGTSKMLPT